MGEADVADWRETMLRLIGDPAFVEGTPILFDVRQSDSNPPPGQGRLLAAMWRDLVPNSRVAVVAGTSMTFNIAKRLETNTAGARARVRQSRRSARLADGCAGPRGQVIRRVSGI